MKEIFKLLPLTRQWVLRKTVGYFSVRLSLQQQAWGFLFILGHFHLGPLFWKLRLLVHTTEAGGICDP